MSVLTRALLLMLAILNNLVKVRELFTIKLCNMIAHIVSFLMCKE